MPSSPRCSVRRERGERCGEQARVLTRVDHRVDEMVSAGVERRGRGASDKRAGYGVMKANVPYCT